MPVQALSGSLEVLSAAQCGLQAVACLAVLGLLQALDLSSNAISDVAQVPKVLAGCQHLRSLSLQGNPICKQTTYRWAPTPQAVAGRARLSLCPPLPAAQSLGRSCSLLQAGPLCWQHGSLWHSIEGQLRPLPRRLDLWEAKHAITLPGPALLQTGPLQVQLCQHLKSPSTLTVLCCHLTALAASKGPALQHLRRPLML